MNLSKEQLIALQDEIEKMGGREAYVDAELKRRNIIVETRIPLIKLVEQARTEAEGRFSRADADFERKCLQYVSERKATYIVNRQKEDALRAELKTLTWAAHKTQNLAYLGDDIFWSDTLGVDFFDPYQRSERRADNDVPELETVADLVDALKEAVPDLDVPKLRWFCYHRDVAEVVHYRTFAIPKKSGGRRYISAPMPQLKAMQKWILDNILVRMPVHEAAHGFVQGRSILTNAAVHTNSEFVLSMDLKDFFPTLTFRRVKGLFRAMGYLEGIATVLALICTESPRQAVKVTDPDTKAEKWVHVAVGPRCLPQGSPASPMLTNLAAMRLDRRLTGFAQNHNIRFTRYADDLTLSTPKGVEHKGAWLQEIVTKVVEDEGFQVHPTKTKLMGRGDRQEVTGLVVNDDMSPRVPTEVKAKLRAAIHNQELGKPFHQDETIDTLLGYASFVYSAQPEKGKSSIEQLLALLDSVDEIK